MSQSSVSPVLEQILLLVLASEQRETISGDLYEEFVHRASQAGRTRASLWYARQVVSFVPGRVRSALSQRFALTAFCAFTAMSGLWLGLIDLYLHRPGYLGREAIAATIVGEAALTLTALYLPRRRPLRVLAMLGCAAILYLAGKAAIGVVTGQHFEGYILLIALALIAQSVLTFATLTGDDRRPAASA